MSDETKNLPVSLATRLLTDHGLRAVAVWAWDGDRQHVVTDGIDHFNASAASTYGNKIKQAFQWPEILRAESARVQAVLDENARLKEVMSDALGLVANAIAHGMPVTKKVADTRNEMCRLLRKENDRI